MSVYKRINKSDVVAVPYTANKQWNFTDANITSSGIFIYDGVKTAGTFNPSTDALTVNSQYKRLVYDNINHQFYQAYSGSILDTTGLMQSPYYESASIYAATGSYNSPINISYGSASFPEAMGSSIKVLSIPTSIYGNSISPNTFCLSSSIYNIVDDGYGNLKDGDVLVGNLFYEYGTAVITHQMYQSFFTDTPVTTTSTTTSTTTIPTTTTSTTTSTTTVPTTTSTTTSTTTTPTTTTSTTTSTTTAAPTTTSTTTSTTTAAPTTTTTSTTTSTTTAGVGIVSVDMVASTVENVGSVYINGHAVNWVSGTDFIVSSGNSGLFNTTQLGTQPVTINLTSTTGGNCLAIIDSIGNRQTSGVISGVNSITFTGVIIDNVTTIQIVGTDGACV